MKKKLIVLIMMSVCAIFNVTADDFASQEKRVAVLPFIIKGKFDPLYAEVALDNFITRLIQGKAYRVVERSQLDKAMKELKFQSSDDFDESSMMEVGKLAGAEIVVIGIITALQNQAVVNIRGISVKTGIAEFAEKDFIRTQEDLLVSVEKIADKFTYSIVAEIQREREAVRQHEIELARQREAEQAKQRAMELAKRREAELEKQRKMELIKQQHEQAKKREAELEKQRKMELIRQQHEQAKKREAELAKQRELEMAKQREAELAKQRELELEKQRKMELIRQQHEQAKQREAELAKQREAELEKQRKMELIKQQHEQAKQNEQESAKHSEKSTPKHWKEKFVNDLEKDLADFERETEQTNQNKKKSNVDFSISKEYDNVPLSQSEKKFLVKYFQQKWKIDPTDTKKVHNIYKKNIGAGAALATMGSIITVAGLAMTIAGFCYFDYCSTAFRVYNDEIYRIEHGDGYYYGFYNKDELRFYEEKRDSLNSFPAFITGIVGIPVIFAVGLPMLISSSYPFGVAKHAKDIYTKITGNKSFTPRVSTTGGFYGKDRKLEIAFGCQF